MAFLFKFVSIAHVLSFVRRLVTELEAFAQRVEAKAEEKRAVAAKLIAEAEGHAAEATQARALASAVSNAAQVTK